MTNYKVHALFGIVFTALMYLAYKHYESLLIGSLYIYIPVVLVYSALPDIDAKESIIRKLTRVILSLIVGFTLIDTLLSYVLNGKFKVLSLLIFGITLGLWIWIEHLKHRKFMHSIVMGIVLSLPLLYYNYYLPIIAFIAYFSHLLIDGKLRF